MIQAGIHMWEDRLFFHDHSTSSLKNDKKWFLNSDARPDVSMWQLKRFNTYGSLSQQTFNVWFLELYPFLVPHYQMYVWNQISRPLQYFNPQTSTTMKQHRCVNRVFFPLVSLSSLWDKYIHFVLSWDSVGVLVGCLMLCYVGFPFRDIYFVCHDS